MRWRTRSAQPWARGSGLDDDMKQRLNVLITEFAHHLPYTIICSLIAMGVVWYVSTTQLAGLTVEQWHT